MNRFKRIVLVLAVIGAFALNLSGRDLPKATDGTAVIEQTAGETAEWTEPVF
jgi:hypothetical protein